MRSAAVLLLMPLLGACIPDTGLPAPTSAELSVPSDLEISPCEAFLEVGDGLAIFSRMDVVVTDSLTGDPLPEIQIEVFPYAGLFVLPQSAVSAISAPDTSGTDCDSEDADPDVCGWQDVASGQYYELVPEYGIGNGDAFRPNYYVDKTDNRGVLSLWALIDALPYTVDDDSITCQDSSILFSLGHTSDVVLITAAQ